MYILHCKPSCCAIYMNHIHLLTSNRCPFLSPNQDYLNPKSQNSPSRTFLQRFLLLLHYSFVSVFLSMIFMESSLLTKCLIAPVLPFIPSRRLLQPFESTKVLHLSPSFAFILQEGGIAFFSASQVYMSSGIQNLYLIMNLLSFQYLH